MAKLMVKVGIYHKVLEKWYNERKQSWEISQSMEEGIGENGEVYAKLGVGYDADKKIKYIRLYLIPYNGVDDVVGKEGSLKLTGPFNPTPLEASEMGLYIEASYESYSVEPLWQDCSIERLKVSKAQILYFDGTEEEIDGESIIEWEDDTVVPYDLCVDSPEEQKINNCVKSSSGCLGVVMVVICLLIFVYYILV